MAKPVNINEARAARAAAKRLPPIETDTPAPEDGDLPEGCPVIALGKNAGVRYYLDADQQLRAIPDKEHNRLTISGLFGKYQNLLEQYWPRHDKRGNVTGWRQDQAAEALFTATSKKGVWEAAERQRGRGAWLGADGELILHTGSHVMTFPRTPDPWRDHTSRPAGLVGHHVYSRGAQTGAPSQEAAGIGAYGPAGELLDLLSTWSWRRPDIDPVLLLGWIGAAMIGGALKWRPMIWLTGGKGSGKSTMQEVLKQLFAGGIIQTADTTAAGLWQAVGFQTLPVTVDELEADDDNRRQNTIVKFARLASSGGLLLRGGSDHQGREFVVRSSFLFSSILIPPLTSQDRSRITVLEMLDLAQGAVAPKLDAKVMARLGGQLMRRMVDGWGRFAATIDRYHTALQAAGHSARSADQLGALLACADLLLFDSAEDNDGVQQWLPLLQTTEAGEGDEQQRDEDRCLQYLLSTSIDPNRNGGRRTVAQWLRSALSLETGADSTDASVAQRVLGTYGLRIEDGRPRMVAIANNHQGLASLFEGSHWMGKSSTPGGWVQTLRRLPGAAVPAKAFYFAGATSKATLLPIDLVVPPASLTQPHIAI